MTGHDHPAGTASDPSDRLGPDVRNPTTHTQTTTVPDTGPDRLGPDVRNPTTHTQTTTVPGTGPDRLGPHGRNPTTHALTTTVARRRIRPAGPAAAGPEPFDPVRHMAARLAVRGARHPQLAAAVLACRGHWILDQRSFAALLGVPVDHIRSLEAGHRPPQHAPHRIKDLAPDVDWAAAGLTERGDPRDPASRHPAGRPHRREHAPP